MKKTVLFVFICLCAMFFLGTKAWADPLYPAVQTFSQPTGLTFQGKSCGDEFLSYVLTEDDYVILMGANDFWYYASVAACEEEGVAADKLQPSGFRYKLDPVPSTALQSEDLEELEHLFYARQIHDQGAAQVGKKAVRSVQSGQKEHKLLCVRVNFANEDKKLRYTDADWSAYMFGESGKTVRSYYGEVSRNAPGEEEKIQFVPATVVNGVAGVVSVDINVPYPSRTDSEGLEPILRSAVLPALVERNLVDFSQFDADDDGEITPDELHIMFVMAGLHYASAQNTNYIHNHAWSFQDLTYMNGVKLVNYTLVAEQNQYGEAMCELGSICHELGHDMGLPDLYDFAKGNDHKESLGVGIYSLMGTGCWAPQIVPPEYKNTVGMTPTHLDAFCKIMLGISGTQRYDVNSTQTFELRTFMESDGYNILYIPTPSDDEYYLLENRQPVGFDAGLDTNGGIAIWHINREYYPYGSGVALGNLRYGERLVDLEEANETVIGQSPLDTGNEQGVDGLFRAGYYTRFGRDTTPSNQMDTKPGAGCFSVEVLSGASSSMQVRLERQMPESISIEPGVYSLANFKAGSRGTPTSLSIRTDTNGNLEVYGEDYASLDGVDTYWYIGGEKDNYWISPYGRPDLRLTHGVNNSVALTSWEGPVKDSQKWRILANGTNSAGYSYIYLCAADSSEILFLNNPKAAMSDDFTVFGLYDFACSDDYLLANTNVEDGAYTFYMTDGQMCLGADADQAYLALESGSLQDGPLWLVESFSGSSTISLPTDPDKALEYDMENGDVRIAEKTGSIYQQWIVSWVNEYVVIHPSYDREMVLYSVSQSAGSRFKVGDIYGLSPAQFVWRGWEGTLKLSSGVYTMTNQATGLVMDAENFGLDDGTKVQQYSYNGGSNQSWTIVNFGGDLGYAIRAGYDSSLYLCADGYNVVLKRAAENGMLPSNSTWDIHFTRGYYEITLRGSNNQMLQPANMNPFAAVLATSPSSPDSTMIKWEISVAEQPLVNTLPEGIYRFENVNSGLYLKGAGGPQAYVLSQEGSEQSKNNNHVWSVQLDDGYYHLHPLSDPKVCITYDEGLGRCVLLPYTGTDNQKWVSLRDKNEQSYRFQLKSRPGQVMVVQNASSAPNENIIIFGDNGTANGKWMAEASLPERVAPDQVALLSNLDSKLVMDAQNFGTLEGTRVLQWSKNYGENQRWIIKMGDDGYYQISPFYAPDLYLSVSSQGKVCLTGAGSAESAKWLFLAGDTANEGYYRLTPKSHPGKVAVVQYASQNQGEEIILYDDNGSHNGYWKPVDQDMELTGSMYQIRNRFTAYYLGADNDGNAQTASVIPGDYQHTIWAVYAGNGYYRFSAYNSGGSELAVSSDGYAIGYGGSGGDPDAALWFVDAEGRIHSKKYPDKVMVIENDQSGEDVAIVLAQVGTLESETWSFERLS